jgi:hypothetical protein
MGNMSQAEINLLVDDWYSDLKDYPSELIFELYREAKKECNFPVKTADIFNKMKLIRKANMPTTNELWYQFLQDGKHIHELVSHFWCDHYMSESGKWYTGRQLKQEAQEYFDGMNPMIKRFAGDIYRLSDYMKMPDSELENITFSYFRRYAEDMQQRSETLEFTNPALTGQNNKMIEG